MTLTEAKSSGTAPLTRNQKEAFPEIEKSGATVVGKGKPGFPGGTQIPSTRVEVIRPEEPLMSIEQTNVIDAIGVETASGKVIMTISDHLDWANEARHVLSLQEKLNVYLRFIEGGELFEQYPDAVNRTVVIDIVTQFPIAERGMQFFKQIEPILSNVGVELRTRRLGD